MVGLSLLRRCLPCSQCGAIGDRDLYFPDAIQANLYRCDSCWIGEIHEQAVAKIGCRANCDICRDEPENERHTSCFSFFGSSLPRLSLQACYQGYSRPV